MQGARLLLKGYLLLGAVIFLFIVSVSIVWELFRKDYPTHSDVFYIGVVYGTLAMLLLVCIVLISVLLYYLARLMRRPSLRKEIKKSEIPLQFCFTSFLFIVSKYVGKPSISFTSRPISARSSFQ